MKKSLLLFFGAIIGGITLAQVDKSDWESGFPEGCTSITAGKLLKSYGWNDAGECLTIADPKEVWHLEIVGPGKDQVGAIWVAQRWGDMRKDVTDVWAPMQQQIFIETVAFENEMTAIQKKQNRIAKSTEFSIIWGDLVVDRAWRLGDLLWTLYDEKF